MQEDTRLRRLMVGDSLPTATVEKEVAEGDNNVMETEQQIRKDIQCHFCVTTPHPELRQ